MEKKSKHFDMRLFMADYKALKALADGDGVTMTAYLVKYVRRQAARQGIPHGGKKHDR